MRKLIIVLFILMYSSTAYSVLYELNPSGSIPSYNNGAGIHIKIYIDGTEVYYNKYLNPNGERTVLADMDLDSLTFAFDTIAFSSTASATIDGDIPIPTPMSGSIPYSITITSAYYELHPDTPLAILTDIPSGIIFFRGYFNGVATININGLINIGGNSYPFNYIPEEGAINVNFCQSGNELDLTNYPTSIGVDLYVSGRTESNKTIFSGIIDGHNIEMIATAGTAWFMYDAVGTPDPSLPLPNIPPVANAGNDQVVFDTVTLDGSTSYDPDGSIVTYDWELKHRQNSTYDRSVSGINPTTPNLEPGFYDVTLFVTDDRGSTVQDTMLLGAAGSCFCTPSKFHIEMIEPDLLKADKGKKYGQALVKVMDDCGNSVSGATVYGTFSGDLSESINDQTGGDGNVLLTTTLSTKSKPGFTFCVDDVSNGTLSYAPDENVETCDSYQ